MSELSELFKGYCHQKIQSVAADLAPGRREEIIKDLRFSPFRSVVQAWSVLDFYRYEHLFAEGYEKYFGWPDKDMTSEFILEIVHPEDREAFGMLYYLVLEGLMNMPIPVKNIGHFCINYRIRKADGEYVRVLETNNILESDPATNIPLICLSQMSKVAAVPDSGKVSYYFLLFTDDQTSVEIMSQFLREYEPAVNVFSETEIKIVRLIQAGLTSKEIADKVFLSKHSIDKYRKNLLKKTGTASTPQMVNHIQNLGLL
jgi:DNA-binding CsgD family transcriptional regulator